MSVIFPILIFAGNYEQARIFAAEQGLSPKQWRHLTIKYVRGQIHPLVYLVGTYYAHPRYPEIMRALEPARAILLNESGRHIA